MSFKDRLRITMMPPILRRRIDWIARSENGVRDGVIGCNDFVEGSRTAFEIDAPVCRRAGIEGQKMDKQTIARLLEDRRTERMGDDKALQAIYVKPCRSGRMSNFVPVRFANWR